MRARCSKGFWRTTRGTTAIEFAMLAVPFLGIAVGIFEFGRACWALEALQESAAQGARCIGVHESGCYASGSYSSSGTIAYVQSVAGGWGISVPTANITPTQSTTCGTVAGFAQIQISYTFTTVAAQLFPGLNQTLNVASCFPLNP